MWPWALLPVCLSILFTTGLWIVYAMALCNGSVDITNGFPFISTCGSFPPQSCIFRQILNTEAVTVLWICAVRFQQIRDYGCHSHLNSASLVTGVLCALGISMTANFQTIRAVPGPDSESEKLSADFLQLDTHLVGAFLAFVLGNVYFWMQSALTYKIKRKHGRNFIGHIRFCLTASCSLLIIMMSIFYYQNMQSVSSICEWIVAMNFLFLFGLFSVDFWHLDGHYFHVKKTLTGFPNERQVSTITMTLQDFGNTS